jgi:hypothetical protein
MRQIRDACRFLVGKTERNRKLGNPRRTGKIILK